MFAIRRSSVACTYWTWGCGWSSVARGWCTRAAPGNRRSGRSPRVRGKRETRTRRRPCESRPRIQRPTASSGPSFPSTCTTGTPGRALQTEKTEIMFYSTKILHYSKTRRDDEHGCRWRSRSLELIIINGFGTSRICKFGKTYARVEVKKLKNQRKRYHVQMTVLLIARDRNLCNKMYRLHTLCTNCLSYPIFFSCD